MRKVISLNTFQEGREQVSIETMQLVQIVGKKHLMNKVIRAAVINGNTHFIDAIDEIHTNKVKIEDYSAGIDSLIEQRTLKRFGDHTVYTEDEELIKSLTNMFLIENKIYDQYVGFDYNYEKIIGRLKFAKTTVLPVSRLDCSLAFFQRPAKGFEDRSRKWSRVFFQCERIYRFAR